MEEYSDGEICFIGELQSVFGLQILIFLTSDC